MKPLDKKFIKNSNIVLYLDYKYFKKSKRSFWPLLKE